MHRFSHWKVPLSEAQSVSEVTALMHNYLGTLGPDVIAALPPSCWDALTVDDLPGSAVVLVREELHYSGKAEIAEMLHEIAHTFVAASTRVASLEARGQPVDAPPDRAREVTRP